MKPRILLAPLALLAVVGFQQADQSTPEATVKAFAAAIQAADFKAAAKLVKGGKPDADFSELVKQFQNQAIKFEILNLKEEVQGDKAKATFTIHMSATGSNGPQDMPDSIQRDRSTGAWLIIPAAAGHATSPFGSLAAFLVDPSKVLAQARGAAVATACLSNMKQICLGFLMLAQDNDEVFKVKSDSWKKAVMPYVKNERVFYCPANKSGGVSYSMNPFLAGKSLASITSPAETVLLYEGRKMKVDFRHGGRANVGYVDGHVKRIGPAEAKKLRWKP